MRIVWDESKRQANILKHGLDFAILDLAFFADAIRQPGHSGRLQAIGRVRGHVVVAVIYKELGQEAVSVISMRPPSAEERKLYHAER